MALHLENELLMISVFPESLSKQAAAWFYQLRNLTGWDDLARVFLERYRFNPHSILEYLGLKEDEEPYVIPDPGVGEVIVEIKEEPSVLSLPALTEGEEEEEVKPLPPAKDPDNATIAEEGEGATQGTTAKQIITTTVAEEEYAGPMVEGLSIHTIAGEEDSTTTPPTRHCQQGEEVKTWTCVPLLQRVSSSNEPRHRHSGPQDSAEARMQAREASTATDEARSHFEDQGRGGKAIEGRFPKHSNLFGLGSQYSPGAEKGRKSSESTNVVFSFMDGFSGYNQIKMAEEDKSKTAFITHWGTFVYDVMPFGLKNAGATYQRAMVTLFHDMIHHEIEVYVDDMIAKSRTAQDHLTDLRKLFQRLKKYQLRLNPNKCAFGVTSGKLLGFIVSGRGIEIDPAKVQAIRSMPAPKTEKEIRSFLGRINYIARFIAQLTATCEPLFKLLRKDVKIKWTEDCQRAFDKIKEYLLNPPILVPPTPGRPLILYLTVQEASMGCMLGQQDETGKKEQAIYYLSKKFTEPETRYLLVEKTCCALAWASKKLRQYMLYYTTWLVSRNGPDQAIKGQAIADYLADYPSEQLELMDSEFPDEDVMTVDEKTIMGQQTPIAVKLGFDCTNNMTEYEACIVGLQAALEFGAYELEVFGDSLLIVSQTNGEWQARDPKLIPYQRYISRLVPKFKYVTFTYTPRAHNHFADALATLASLIKLVEGDDVRPLRIETRDIPAYCVCIEECMNVEAEIDNKPWYYDIKRFIQDREDSVQTELMTPPSLRCVDAEEANRLIQEMHAGLMGAHANGPFLARKIMRAGYYWLTMERDCIRHVQTCHKCQMYQNSKNAPPQYLHTMASPWPFSAWGMDVIGAITPKASNGHEFILVAIDYFTKWVEACSFKNVTQVAVTRFVKNNIICRYGMPEMLITDNASNLNNRMMDQLCQQFKIQHHNSAPYRPKMNGAVEAANKNVKKILSKMTETYKDWHEHLPYALCAYRTSVRTSVGATPYSLVYGMEAVLPVEVEIPSLRILSQTQLEEAEWAQATLYQRRIERAYNKKARPRTFQPGDLVLKKRNMALSDPRGKFAPSYEGPYVVKKAFSGGAIILADMDGEEFRSPINSDSVIKYHV
uniref:Integrase catalytic domain-containing protein n=1 Tax=Fagus sylvatica TaxID=28930 RepID=A0A2N9G0I6_FAGSY